MNANDWTAFWLRWPRIHVASGGFTFGERRYEPCACGGVISAMPGEEHDAVAWHNGTERHTAWRAAYHATVGDG